MSKRRITACMLLAVQVGTVAVLASAARGDDAESALFPEAYGIIGRERYLFPMEMGDWPVKIDSKHQLFADNYLVQSMTGLTRQYHKLKPHPANPIFTATASIAYPVYLMRDPEGLYRMWYLHRISYRDRAGNRRRYPTGYIESRDGIDWHGPTLGLVVADGTSKNNFVFEKLLAGIFHEPWEKDPARRFKALAHFEPDNDENQDQIFEGYWLYSSSDGIHWTEDRPYPVIKSLTGYTLPQPGVGDTTSYRWDPLLARYVGNVKFVLPGKYRAYGIFESEDLIHWTRPRMMFYRDEKDPEGMQFYAHYTFHYESMWFGFVKTMSMTEPERGKPWKHCELQLSLSRDGRNFTRCPDRTPVLPVSDKADAWDGDYPAIAPGHVPLRVGNQLWFYYSDRRHWNRPGPKPKDAGLQRLGLATLRVDGFASLNAGPTPGAVVTRPLTFAGSRLFANAEIGDEGWIRVALVTSDNRPVPGYGLEDAVAIETGGLELPITWKQANAYELPAGRHVRLKIELQNAKLYSFWIR